MVSKTDEINFENDGICSIYTLLNPENSELFLKKAIDFLKENKFSKSKFSRFVQLLRTSDVLITDSGELNDYTFNMLLYLINHSNLSKKQKDMLEGIIIDINILKNIKSNNIQDINNTPRDNLIDFVNSYNVTLLKLFTGIARPSNPAYEYEKIILFISRIIKVLINNNALDFSDLNKLSNKPISTNNCIVQVLNFEKAIELWKYADASIKLNSGKYIIDGWTEKETDFIISRNDNQNNRLLQYNKNQLSENKTMMVKLYGILRGITELWNIDIPLLPKNIKKYEVYTKLSSSELSRLLKEKINDVPLYKWIILLEKMKEYYNEYIKKHLLTITKNPYLFQSINVSKFSELTGLTNEEIKKIFNNISMTSDHKSDLFDTPIIYYQGNYYSYALTWPCLDSIYTIYNVMKRSRNSLNAFQQIGKNLESEINDALINYKYDSKFQTIKNEKFGDREVDLIVKDVKSKDSVLIECKTFNIPTSIKDYAIQLDKIFSHNHISNAQKNFDKIKQKDSIKSFLKGTNIKEIFIANIIIPNSYRRLFGKKDILYIPYFTFYKLLTTPKEKLNCEFNNLLEENCFGQFIIGTSLGKEDMVTLDTRNILGKNLDILSKKEPKIQIYLNKDDFIKKEVGNNLINYTNKHSFTASELDCGFLKLRYIE